MFFSEYYGIDSSVVEHYGAVDISFVCDIPLFIDPMLIFNSEKEEYKKLHEEIIRYFHFLYQQLPEYIPLVQLRALMLPCHCALRNRIPVFSSFVLPMQS